MVRQHQSLTKPRKNWNKPRVPENKCYTIVISIKGFGLTPKYFYRNLGMLQQVAGQHLNRFLLIHCDTGMRTREILVTPAWLLLQYVQICILLLSDNLESCMPSRYHFEKLSSHDTHLRIPAFPNVFFNDHTIVQSIHQMQIQTKLFTTVFAT